MDEQKNSFLETEKIGTLMRKYTFPCIVSLLVGALYNIVDQIFIANADYLGSYGNAANTVVFPLTVIALAIATMIGDGCCAFVSIRLGAKDHENAHRSVGTSITLTVALGIILMAIYLVFSNGILNLFGAGVNEETFRFSKEYFFWISLGIPFYMFGQALNPVIRSDGGPSYAMICLLSGAVTNIILDPIFIFPLKWGMAGAAAATSIGQAVSAVLSLLYLFRMKAIKLQKNSFKPRFSLIKKILPLGMTSFLSQVSIVFSMAAVLNVCKIFGAKDSIFSKAEYAQIPTAVVGIVMKFFQIVMSVSIGLSAGCIPIVGYNIGAKRGDRAKQLMKKMLFAEAVVGAVALLIFELFPKQLIGIFGAGNESVHYTDFAVRSIRIFLSSVVFACVNKGMFIFLQSVGKAAASTALSVLREIVCGVGLVLLLPLWFGLDGVLYFMPLSDVITFATGIFVLCKTAKELEANKL